MVAVFGQQDVLATINFVDITSPTTWTEPIYERPSGWVPEPCAATE